MNTDYINTKLLTASGNVAQLFKTYSADNRDEDMYDEVVEAIVGLGLVEEEASQALSIIALLTFHSISTRELGYVIYTAVNKVLHDRAFDHE